MPEQHPPQPGPYDPTTQSPYPPGVPYGQPHHGAQPPYGGHAGWGQLPYPYAPHPGLQPKRGTNGLAVASMVLGIIWLCYLGSVLALIFGYVARRQIRENDQYGDGMAIAGIVLGWIGVGVFCLTVVFDILTMA